MNDRRSMRSRLEERLRRLQPQVDAVWQSVREEAMHAGGGSDFQDRLERRMTWTLWNVAMREAVDVMAEIEAEEPEPELVPPWVCQSCKRRILRLVSNDGEISAAG